MSIAAATIILVLVVVIALLLAAPFIYIARRNRTKRNSQASTFFTSPLTWKEATPGVILVAALLLSFATAYVAPESWIGSRVQTLEGKGWLFILLWLVIYSLERAVRSFQGRR